MTTKFPFDGLESAAGNGLLHRRLFLAHGAALLGGGAAWLAPRPARAAPLETPEWMKTPGAPLSGYGERSAHEAGVQRLVGAVPGVGRAPAARARRSRDSRASITPSSLHFERHHSGVPDIDPDRHRLLIHGLVERPLLFDSSALLRYPLVSRIQFLECSGNSGALNRRRAAAADGRRRCTVSCRAASGPACRSASCSRRPASGPRRAGCSPKARTRLP